MSNSWLAASISAKAIKLLVLLKWAQLGVTAIQLLLIGHWRWHNLGADMLSASPAKRKNRPLLCPHTVCTLVTVRPDAGTCALWRVAAWPQGCTSEGLTMHVHSRPWQTPALPSSAVELFKGKWVIY